MGDRQQLESAITSFQLAERELRKLADQTQELVLSVERLDSTEAAFASTRTEIVELVKSHQELSSKLSGLSQSLADTSRVLQSIDPSKLYGELERIRHDFQSQIERIGVLGGELRLRMDSLEGATQSQIVDSYTRLASLVLTTNAKARRLVFFSILLGLGILVGQISQIVGG